MGLYRWLITGRWNAPGLRATTFGEPGRGEVRAASVGNPFTPKGEPLVNPYEKPETDESRIRRKLGSGECPDCGSTGFHERGAMKGDETSIIKFVQCAKCGSKFKIRFIDHPLNPIEAERN